AGSLGHRWTSARRRGAARQAHPSPCPRRHDRDGRVRRGHDPVPAARPRCRGGRPRTVAQAAQALDGGAARRDGVVVPVRRAARDARAAGDRHRHARGLRAPAPARLRPAHPLGPQPPRRRPGPLRPDVRRRRPRAGGARTGDHPHPPREHHRQRDARRGHRQGPRARAAVRAQARARDDPDDRHRRPVGPDELRQAWLGRRGNRDREAARARPRPRTGRGRAHLSGGNARDAGEDRPRPGDHRRAPAGHRPDGRPPAPRAAAAPRRAARAARRARRRRRRRVRPRRPRRLRVHQRHLGRRPRRHDGAHPLLAPRRGRRARGRGGTDGLALRALAGARRLGRRAPRRVRRGVRAARRHTYWM
ncbi:MAG: hypothetical protein AVDCRST_MAG85-1227, partial [uncultured Solirubrobacteraceae bacterium]